MEAAGAGANPYSRFSLEELHERMKELDSACEERATRLIGARARIDELDADKKAFAEAAEKALAFIKAEKAALEARTKEGVVKPDDADSITQGKEKLAYLSEYSAKAAERADCLADAQKISDTLMAAGEVDNPYTRHSMVSLKSALDQLEKLVRDVVNLVEGQLSRAVASISPEEHEELKKAFAHFDKSGDTMLNAIEFAAASKAMDLDVAEDVHSKFADRTHMVENDDGEQVEESCISFDAFLTIVLQQYKDKDTPDGLIAAFRTLANGKETLPADVLQYKEGSFIKESDIAYLASKLTAAPDGTFEYAAFTTNVYGSSGSTATPVS